MGFDITSFLMGKAAGGGGGGGGDPALPAEYQEVEYLHNDGNCWCVIDFKPLMTDWCEIKFSLGSDAASTECGIVGGFVNTGSYNWEIYTENNAITTYGNYMINAYGMISGISRDTAYVSGFQFDTKSSPSTFYWGRYRTDRYPFKGNMYYCKLYAKRGDVELTTVKLVPCKRKSDSVPGFYDLTNSAFYTNSGTGTFTPGPDVN